MSEDNTNVEETVVNSAAQSISLDDIKRLSLEDESIKTWLQSEKDKNFSKGLDTWKQNNLSSLVDEEVKKLYPEETPEQRKIRELEARLTKSEQEKQKETIRNQAYKQANEKKLPVELLDFFVGADLDTTNSNLETLEKVWKQSLEAAVGETFKANGREPHKSTKASTNTVNPWKQETFNLTKQGQILQENPELAKTLQSQAK
jgi:hypothetical protein